MPELPEVETIKRDLQKHLLGLRITAIRIHDSRVIGDMGPKEFIKTLKGRTMTSIERRAKAVVIQCGDPGYLVIQPKMTGQLIYGKDLKAAENLKETKITFELSDGRFLNYNDQRLFGRLRFVTRLEDHAYLRILGPEPLSDDFNVDWLIKELKAKKTPIKMLLMNQEFVAGIGNIYASEILFSAGIDPAKPACRLKEDEVKALHKATGEILNLAIKGRGSSMRNYRDSYGKKGNYMNQIKVYGRENERCYHCSSAIKRIVQGARSTFFCKKCQQ